MSDQLIELETAARIAAQVSTLGLSIRIEVEQSILGAEVERL